MKKTVYRIKKENIKLPSPMSIAIVSDLHGRDPVEAISLLKEERPNIILMPGDIFEELNGNNEHGYENSLKLLYEASKIAPTFYSTGNHEDGATRSWNKNRIKTVEKREYSPKSLNDIKNSGAVFICDDYVVNGGMAIGGLATGLIFEEREPKTEWLADFCAVDMPKILLCHHPEYYEKYLKDKDINLIVSGHAHGGQWRFFGRGVFAPGQGLFPKYTYGVHDGRFVISTGLKTGTIPRFFNPPEVVFVVIE